MEPYVFRETILDQIFILVLVFAYVNGILAASGGEIIDHYLYEFLLFIANVDAPSYYRFAVHFFVLRLSLDVSRESIVDSSLVASCSTS